LVVLTDNDQAGRESKIKINRSMSRLFNLAFPQMHTKDLGDMKVEKIESEILINLRGCY
jgi:5S rRNA maturation endonuclease (ribonuclease M5)